MSLKVFDEAEFKREVRRAWFSTPTPMLRRSIELNDRLMKQIQIRNQAIRELLDERTEGYTDYKSKQCPD